MKACEWMGGWLGGYWVDGVMDGWMDGLHADSVWILSAAAGIVSIAIVSIAIVSIARLQEAGHNVACLLPL